MSLGLVVLEKKLFTRTRTPTPQSDDKSADIKKANTATTFVFSVGVNKGKMRVCLEL